MRPICFEERNDFALNSFLNEFILALMTVCVRADDYVRRNSDFGIAVSTVGGGRVTLFSFPLTVRGCLAPSCEVGYAHVPSFAAVCDARGRLG